MLHNGRQSIRLAVSFAVLCVWGSTQTFGFDEGCTGSWAGGPTSYILSGGPSAGDNLSADDQMNVCVNGQRLFADWNAYAGPISPISFTAHPGDTLRVTSFDYFGGCRGRSALWVHSGDGQSKELAGSRQDGCEGFPSQYLFDDVSFALPAWKTKGLEATLEVDYTTAAVTDLLTLTLTITNTSNEDITNVHGDGILTVTGDGAAIQKNGPVPDLPVTLAASGSTQFTYTYEITKIGKIVLSGSASGQKLSDSSVVASEPAQSPEITLVDPFKLKNILMAKGNRTNLVPANVVSFLATLEKQSLQPIDAGSLKVTLSQTEGLIRGKDSATGTPPDATGEFIISMTGRVEDERNKDIFEKLLRDRNTIPLDDGMTLHLDWTKDGQAKTADFKGTPKDENDAGWLIDYPNWAAVTGEPPLITTDAQEQTTEREFYAKGNKITDFAKGYAHYSEHPLVRKWVLRSTRKEDDDYAPDNVKDAAENIAFFLGARIPARWQGDRLSIPDLVTLFENGGTPPAYPCIGFATTVTGFARVMGIRSREIDNALLYLPLTGYWWAQHGTAELWYDGAWHWYDLFFASKNGGKPIREDGYPDFYLKSRYIYYKYREIRSYAAVSEAFLSDFCLVGDGSFGAPANFSKPVSQWRAYKYATDTDSQVHINTFSPVTTLYTDAQGRRLGALGTLSEADFYTKDKSLPLTGGNSLWEVPGAVYIAPGTPTSVNTIDPLATRELKEALIIPRDEFTDTFKLTFTGTGDGPFEVKVWVESAEGPVDLVTYSGDITAGQEITRTYKVDHTAELPVVTDVTVTSNLEPSGQEVPNVPACGAGTAGCGANAVGVMPIMLLGLGWMKRSCRRY